MKLIYLDMDGTIADLYRQKDWVEYLRREDESIYLNAKPLISEKELFILYPLTEYRFCVLSMLPYNSTAEFRNRVAKAKDEWMDKYFPTITERIYLPYSDSKNLEGCEETILIDDSKKIRATFRGVAIAPVWC